MSPWGLPSAGTVRASAARKASRRLWGACASLAAVTRVSVGNEGVCLWGFLTVSLQPDPAGGVSERDVLQL